MIRAATVRERRVSLKLFQRTSLWLIQIAIAKIFFVGCIADLVATSSVKSDSVRNVNSGGPARIDSFFGEYRFLSNFWPAVVEYEGLTYPSVEHAYQAAKTLDINERRHIAAIVEPGDAKRAGRAAKQRPDWERVKMHVMEDCVRYKFTHHAELRKKLLATGDAELVEGNTWGDRFWGVCDGQGENHLGKILMKVRAELRVETTPP